MSQIDYTNKLKAPKHIKPGQMWLDDKGIFDYGYNGEMLYIVCSQEPEQPWVCMCFQEWEMGAYKREFNEAELNRLKYVGSLKELREYTAIAG